MMSEIQKPKCTKEKRRLISYSVLVQIYNAFKRRIFGTFLDTMLQAACSTALFAYLRCLKFTINNIKQGNIYTVYGYYGYGYRRNSFHSRSEKIQTDHFRKGINIRLFQSSKTVCQVWCMKNYILFRRNWLHRKVSSASFVDESGHFFIKTLFSSKLKQILKSLGFNDEKFQGDSIKIGTATPAVTGQVEDNQVKTLRQWSSDCFTSYIRSDDQTVSCA